MTNEHPDYQEDLQMIAPLIEAVNLIAEKLEAVEGRLGAVEKSLFEELIGGIDSLYKKNMRAESIEGLKAKYGPKFEPHAEAFGTMYPGIDIWEKIEDLLEEARGKEDFDEEGFGGKIDATFDEIANAIGKIRGVKSDVPAEAEPEAVKVEVEKTEVDTDDIDKRIVERLKKDPSMRGV